MRSQPATRATVFYRELIFKGIKECYHFFLHMKPYIYIDKSRAATVLERESEGEAYLLFAYNN